MMRALELNPPHDVSHNLFVSFERRTHMTWFVAAIVSAFALSGQALMFQQLQKNYSIPVYMSYVWMGAALLLSLVFFRPDDIEPVMDNMLLLVLAGLSSLAGQFCFNQAIKSQNNIGYIEAVSSIRIPFAYLFSIVAFEATFDMLRLGGVIAISVGVLIVGGVQRLRLDEFKVDWLGWSLGAGFSFGMLTILVRYATDGGVTAEVATVIVLVVAGLAFIGLSVAEKESFVIKREHLVVLIAAILFATVGNSAEFISFELAPNLAYSIAIDNTRIIILYIAGLILFSEQLNRRKGLGVLITFAGVVMLA